MQAKGKSGGDAKLHGDETAVHRRPHFPSLDGLRCLAILPIIWHHATPYPLEGVLGRGPLGVDLFFVVSGFLITSLLLHERRTHALDLGRFWVRRSLRIFPLYYLVLGAFTVHAIFLRAPGPARDHFLATVPYYLTYTSNWFSVGPVDHPIVFAFAWSLAAEEQFYLFWPPVLRWVRGLLGPALVMIALVALDQCAERGWLSPFIGEGLPLRMLRSFATPIGLGALLAITSAAPLTARAVHLVLARRGSSLVALAFVAAATIIPWPVFPTHLAMTALVGACALRRNHWLAPLFEHRVVRHVGTVSYGIYLLNVPIAFSCRGLVGDRALSLFVVSTLLSVAAATATYRWIERPFLTLRERFRAGAPSAAEPSSAPSARQNVRIP